MGRRAGRVAPETLALLAIVALAAGLRLFRLGHLSLWLDESFTWWAVSQSFADVWAVVPVVDQHPPLFYLLLKLWTLPLGDGEAALRGLSAVAGIATVPVVWLAGRSLGGGDGARVGLTAAALFALAPVQLQYAQEARPYALLTLAVACAVAGALRLAASPDAARRPLLGWGGVPGPDAPGARLAWAALVGGTALALWLHNLATFLVAALALAGLVGLWREHRWHRAAVANALLAAGLVGIAWSPFLFRFLAQAGGVAALGFWIPAPDWRQVARTLDFLFAVRFLKEPPTLWPLVAVAALGLLALARRGRGGAALLLAATALLPLALSLLVSVAVQPILLGRTLLWTTVPFYLALASAPLLLPRRWAWPGAAVAALLACLFAAGSVGYFRDHEKEPWRNLVQRIGDEWRPGDLLVLVPAFQETLVDYYATRQGRRDLLRVFPPSSGRGEVVADADDPVPAAVDDAGLEELRRALPADGRVWLVLRGADRYDPDGRTRRLLEGQGRPLAREERVFGRYMRLYLYDAPPAPETAGAGEKR